MECQRIEEHLTEYVDRSLSAQEMARVAEHLHECSHCSGLVDEIRSLLVNCKTFPVLQPELALVERILLRTSGRPRTRSFRELVTQYFVRPILTPRFAVGAGLATLFLVFSLHLLWPRVSTMASVLSPKEVFRQMDRGVQQLYGNSLKIYDKKNEWQAQIGFFKNNVLNKLGFMIEQLDVPVEGKQESGEPRQQQEKRPGEKSNMLLLPA